MTSLDIQLTGVSFSYGSGDKIVEVLREIDLEIPRGKLTTIVGPSGCGKSSLLKLMAGLLETESGKIWRDETRRRDGTSFVPQQSTLLPWRTARQNACLGLEVRAEITQKTELDRQELEYVDSLLENWRLGGFENAYPNELSGGMIQRVALIRSLATKPRLLFCDEPFSAIDFVTRLRLSNEFKNLCFEDQITTVLVTHNIEEAIFLGDQVVVLSGRPGQIVNVHFPKLRDGSNVVAARSSKEFGDQFSKIWKELEDNQT